MQKLDMHEPSLGPSSVLKPIVRRERRIAAAREKACLTAGQMHTTVEIKTPGERQDFEHDECEPNRTGRWRQLLAWP